MARTHDIDVEKLTKVIHEGELAWMGWKTYTWAEAREMAERMMEAIEKMMEAISEFQGSLPVQLLAGGRIRTLGL